jgi:hypothetical protein
VALLGLVVPSSPPAAGGTRGPASLTAAGNNTTFPSPIRHVILFWFENHELGQILRWNLPFEKQLAANFSLAGQFYSVRHNSEPDYLAAAGGIDQNAFRLGGYNVTDVSALLAQHNESWVSYWGGMPQPCYGNYAWSTGYEETHDPFVQFHDVWKNHKLCASHVLPFNRTTENAWNASLKAGTVPNYVWIDPDIFNDQHSGPPGVGSAWLQSVVTPIEKSPIWNSTAIVVTYDEGTGTSMEGFNATAATPLLNTTGGLAGNIYTVIASPLVRAGYNSTHPFQTYSILTTTEWLLGLCPGGGCTGTNDQWSLYPPMKDLFSFEPAWSPSGYSVSGTVTNTTTGIGIPGAHVVVTSASYANGTDTDHYGRWSMDIPNGTYSVYVSAYGYEMAKNPTSITVRGVPVTNLVFVLGEAPSVWFPISGHVTLNGTRTGLGGIQVLFTSNSTEKETWTNGSGYFSWVLPNGTYTATALGYPYYTNASQNITMNGTALRGVDFALNATGLAPPTLYPIAGSVVDPAGRPVPGAQVNALGPFVNETVNVSATGLYNLSLPNGTYLFTANASAFTSNSTTVQVNGSAVVQNFTLRPIAPATYNLTGFVLNATSAPLPNASLTVSGPALGGPAVVRTNASGAFAIPLPNGTYSVNVTRPGYMGQSASATVAGAPAWLNFTLVHLPPPDYAVTGTVTNLTGARLASVNVTLAPATGGPASSRLTNASGGFAFTVPNGTYALAFAKSGYISANASVAVEGGPVAGTYILRPQPPPRYTLSGVIESALAAPIGGANVTVTNASGGVLAGTTDASGAYAFSLVNGTYTLAVHAAGYYPASSSVRIRGAPLEKNVTLTARPPTQYSLSGVVTNATGAPISRANVTLSGSAGAPRWTYSNRTGAYAFTLENGSYNLTVTKTGYLPAEGLVEVNGMAVAANFSLALRPPSRFAVSGLVETANATPLAGVALSVLGHTTTATGVTGPDGTYAFSLPNGSYSLTARLAGYETRSRSFVVNGTSLAEPALVLSTAPVLRYEVDGTVAGVDGAPIAGAVLWANVSNGTGPSVRTTTNASGGFVFHLANGTYLLTALAPGQEPSVQFAHVAGRPLTGLAFILSPIPMGPPPVDNTTTTVVSAPIPWYRAIGPVGWIAIGVGALVIVVAAVVLLRPGARGGRGGRAAGGNADP